MKFKKVILNFVMFLTIAVLGTGVMGCRVKAASVNSIYSALKAKSGLKNAKQWMVIKEHKHDYLVLASQTSVKQFRKDKAKIVTILGNSPSYPNDGKIQSSPDYDMYYVKAKKEKTHVKAVNIDPNKEEDQFWESDCVKVANSVQIYNSLKEVAEAIGERGSR